jgi:hypothetical protein
MNRLEGITDAHRGTWSRLTRLHTASASLPTQTKRVEDDRNRTDDSFSAL